MKAEPRARTGIMSTEPSKGKTRGGGGPIAKNATGFAKHNINKAKTYNTMPDGYKNGSC
jgi:hypothetical protein